MTSPSLFSIKAMLARLENPYWSPVHPTKYALNCEGDYGPGVEFRTNPHFRPAWNIFWAMSYKLNTPKQVAKLNVDLMHKVIEAAVAVSRINITVAGTRFSVGQLSLLMPHGDRLIAYDNLMLPLYAWIMDKSEQGWSKPKRIEIEPEYTYEHIVSAYATDDLVYLITRGVNHGKSMQFLRRFDRNAEKSELLLSETKKDIYSENSENEAMFESGQEWSQVMATEAGTVLIAAGDHGLGRYNVNSELMYLGNQPANYIELIDQGVSVAVAFQNREKASPLRWEIDVYLTEGQSEFPRLQLSSI